MINILKNIQNKPESVKRMIMWLGVFFIMAVIFIFWLATFPSQIPVTASDPAAENIKKELPGILKTMKDQYNNLKDMWAIRLR